jgi:hypothetical protein
MNCKHDRVEYWQMKDGEEWWVCMDCGEKFTQPLDCIGG